ncbi:hypothetical protein BsWGS_06294 [Bradybaena similaris]
MLARLLLLALAVVCACTHVAARGVKLFPARGYAPVPAYRGSVLPAFRGGELSQNKGTANTFFLKGKNRNPFARPQDFTQDDKKVPTINDGVPSPGSSASGRGSRRYRRDFSGYGYRGGFFPGSFGAPYGAPIGDYGQDFGYSNDNYRSK